MNYIPICFANSFSGKPVVEGKMSCFSESGPKSELGPDFFDGWSGAFLVPTMISGKLGLKRDLGPNYKYIKYVSFPLLSMLDSKKTESDKHLTFLIYEISHSKDWLSLGLYAFLNFVLNIRHVPYCEYLALFHTKTIKISL